MTRVLLIHGLAGSARSFARLAPLLGDHIAVDLPGHGASAGTDGVGSIAEMAAAVRAGLDEPVIAVGHSMGGCVAAELATVAPQLVTRVVLVNSPPTVASRLTANSGGERAIRLPVVGPLLWRTLPERTRRSAAATAVAPGTPVPDVFVEDAARLTWTAFVRSTGAVDAFLAERSLHERVAALAMPVTIVFGERDRRVALDSLNGYADTHATVVRIPEAGHSPIWETPERVAEIIGSGPSS